MQIKWKEYKADAFYDELIGSTGRPRKAEVGDIVYWGEWKAVHDKSLWQIREEDRRAPTHWSGNPQIRILMYGVVLMSTAMWIRCSPTGSKSRHRSAKKKVRPKKVC